MLRLLFVFGTLPNIRKIELKKTFNIILGITLSLGIPFLGLLLTNIINHGFAVVLSIILTPLIGIYLLKNKKKQIGIGILIGLIPLTFLIIVFINLSKLH